MLCQRPSELERPPCAPPQLLAAQQLMRRGGGAARAVPDAWAPLLLSGRRPGRAARAAPVARLAPVLREGPPSRLSKRATMLPQQGTLHSPRTHLHHASAQRYQALLHATRQLPDLLCFKLDCKLD